MSQSFEQDKLVVSDLSALSDRRLRRCAARFSTRLNLVPSIVSLSLSLTIKVFISTFNCQTAFDSEQKEKCLMGCARKFDGAWVVSWLKVWQWGAASNFSLSLEQGAVELILLKLWHCIDTFVKQKKKTTQQCQLCYCFNLCFWNNSLLVAWNRVSGNFILWRCLKRINWKNLDT